MAGSVQDANHSVAQFKLLAVVQRFKRESNFSGAGKTIRRAEASRGQTSARSMVGVHVGVKHVRNLQSFFLGEGGLGFDVTLLRSTTAHCPTVPQPKP